MVEAAEPHGIVWCHRIDPLARRQLTAPPFVIPVAVRDPRPSGNRSRKFRDAPNEFLARPCVAQLHRREADTALEKMNVRVDESGNEHHRARIDNLRRRTQHLARFGTRPDEGDALARYHDGVGPRTPAIARPHASVHDGERRRPGGRFAWAIHGANSSLSGNAPPHPETPGPAAVGPPANPARPFLR